MREIRLDAEGYLSFYEDGREVEGFATADHAPKWSERALMSYGGLILQWRSGEITQEQLEAEVEEICLG